MGTVAVSTEVKQATKPETQNYALVGERVKTGTDAEGNDKFKTEVKAISNEKDIDDARKNGKIVFEQTISYDLAVTPEGFAEIIKDPDERVLVFNAGIKASRLNPRVKKLLEELDDNDNPAFQPVEGTYDVRELINEPAQRKFLSPFEKAQKVLAAIPGLTAEQLQTLLAGYATQASPEASVE